MRLGAAALRVGDSDPKLRAVLTSIVETTSRMARDLRSTMIELAPPELEKHGIRASLEQLLGKLERDEVEGHLDCPELDLDRQRLRLVYRVVREAMRNAIKYSGCPHFWVTVRLDDDTVTATMRDDGRGFSAEQREERQKEGHNGLGNLEQIVIDGGGQLTITSEPGAGTTITLVAPPVSDPFAESAMGDATARADEPSAEGQGGPGAQPQVDRRGYLGDRVDDRQPSMATDPAPALASVSATPLP